MLLIGGSIGEQAGDVVECARQLTVRGCDETRDLLRVVGVELGLDWSGLARRRVELRFEEPGRSMAVGTGSLLSFLGGVREGGRCRLMVFRPGGKGLHVGKGAASERFRYSWHKYYS